MTKHGNCFVAVKMKRLPTLNTEKSRKEFMMPVSLRTGWIRLEDKRRAGGGEGPGQGAGGKRLSGPAAWAARPPIWQSSPPWSRKEAGGGPASQPRRDHPVCERVRACSSRWSASITIPMNTPEVLQLDGAGHLASPNLGSSATLRITSAPRTPRWTPSAASGTRSALVQR